MLGRAFTSKLSALFSLLLLLAACFSALKLVTYPLVHFYHEGHCTITSDLTYHDPGVGGNNGRPASFRPDYGFTLHTAEGVTFPTYQVGQTYPC